MIRLRKIYAGLFLLCSVSANAQSFSLKDAVDYAIVHHVQVKNSQIDLQNAGAKINEIKAMGLPQVSAAASQLAELGLLPHGVITLASLSLLAGNILIWGHVVVGLWNIGFS